MPGTILALTRYDRLGASSRVRVLQYIPALEQAGFKIHVQPLFAEDDLRRLYRDGRRSPARLMAAFGARISAILRSRRSDVIWLQQEIFPFLPFGVEAALLGGRKLVIDFDDAHHLYYKDAASGFTRRLYGDKIERLMRRADAVVTGSPVMENYARGAGARKVYLVYSAVDTLAVQAMPPATPFTVGWIGTPMTARQSLHIVHEPLGRFLAETKAQALFIGMDATQFPDLPGERLPWSEDAERSGLARLSVGICPLDDSPWTRGKSGYKIIQYMAAGKPTLTSPIGIAADIVDDGTTGFHCRTADDWYRRLHQLYGDPELLRTLGEHGRRHAEARYDSSIAAAQLVGIFKDCLRG